MSGTTEGPAAPSRRTAARRAAAARSRLRIALVSGLGGCVVVGTIAGLGTILDAALLIAPFGATCVLVFALPQSPLARPRNVIGGHLLSSAAGLAVLSALGDGPVAFGVAAGLAIVAMQATETLHPPAGADPILVLATGAGWSFLLVPILVVSSAIVGAAWCYHRLVSGRRYPG